MHHLVADLVAEHDHLFESGTPGRGDRIDSGDGDEVLLTDDGLRQFLFRLEMEVQGALGGTGDLDDRARVEPSKPFCSNAFAAPIRICCLVASARACLTTFALPLTDK